MIEKWTAAQTTDKPALKANIMLSLMFTWDHSVLFRYYVAHKIFNYFKVS